MKKLKILLADDHEVIRDGIKALLEKNPTYSVIGEAANGVEAIEKTSALHPDILLLDISMPKQNGMEAAREISKSMPDVKVIILSMFVDTEHISKCLELDVMGYIVKTHGGKEIINAIEMVSTRRKFYSNEVTQTILDNYRQQRIASHTRKSKPKVELTNREKQIIGLIAQGMTNQEIAEKLNLFFVI
jgi:DNA-binding NarL/FixJ family response regulator